LATHVVPEATKPELHAEQTALPLATVLAVATPVVAALVNHIYPYAQFAVTAVVNDDQPPAKTPVTAVAPKITVE